MRTSNAVTEKEHPRRESEGEDEGRGYERGKPDTIRTLPEVRFLAAETVARAGRAGVGLFEGKMTKEHLYNLLILAASSLGDEQLVEHLLPQVHRLECMLEEGVDPGADLPTEDQIRRQRVSQLVATWKAGRAKKGLTAAGPIEVTPPCTSRRRHA